MAGKNESRTNVMRVLQKAGIPFIAHEYPHGNTAIDGVSVANLLGQKPDTVFKTMVSRGKTGGIYVFCIPVAAALNLKKAALAVGEKSIELVHVKELLALTGYVRGGCSPIGMKKAYRTVLHTSGIAQERIIVSAGKIGYQVELAPTALLALVGADTADVID